MWNFIIRLGDSEGENFRIKLSLPLFGTLDEGTWETVDFGHIAPIGGSTKGIRNSGSVFWWDMKFFPSHKDLNGSIKFYNIFGPTGFAKEGDGEIDNFLCLSFATDSISKDRKGTGSGYVKFGWTLD